MTAISRQGFVFVECAEQFWHEKDAFVLVFQRAADLQAPDRDPHAPGPIADGTLPLLLPESGKVYRRVAFVALGKGRELIDPILQATSCTGVDIVLEEWATQKDERPTMPPGVTLPSALTEKGDPHLGGELLDAVFFLDSYHLLFHGPTLLSKLHERLADTGRVYVLDRRATRSVSRREASHLRMIALETVKEELSQAGFRLLREDRLLTDERFLLAFGAAEAAGGASSSREE